MNRFNCHGNICPGNICPGDICPYQEYLSCYSADFDQTLKVGSWDHLDHIQAVMLTFVQTTLVLATFVDIRNISAVTDLILTILFGTTFFTNADYHSNICPGIEISTTQDKKTTIIRKQPQNNWVLTSS